jgi:hypothetical protein
MIKLNPENVIRIWKNKGQILEGVVNKVFKKDHIEEIASERFAICESNICGMFDADGSSERAVAKGKPSCAGCGCALEFKTRCLSCHCHLKDVGQHPLWVDVITPVEETILIERMKQDEAQADSTNQG